MTTFEDLEAAREQWSERILGSPIAQRLPGMVGLGIGRKFVAGKLSGQLCVKFLVQNKRPEHDIPARERLPKTIDGVLTDVEGSAPFIPFLPLAGKSRMRPFRPGCSIGVNTPYDDAMDAGTLGAIVYKGNEPFLLGANHVLTSLARREPPVDVYQPGLADGGQPAMDTVAQLVQAVPLCTDEPNWVDCAIAKPITPKDVARDILEIGVPAGVGTAKLDLPVKKYGRFTQLTHGKVVAVNLEFPMPIGDTVYSFIGQVLIEGDGDEFAASGDSGALVVDARTRAAVGLLMGGSPASVGGSPTRVVANPIQAVLDALDVTLNPS
jgi:hypothetical protein